MLIPAQKSEKNCVKATLSRSGGHAIVAYIMARSPRCHSQRWRWCLKMTHWKSCQWGLPCIEWQLPRLTTRRHHHIIEFLCIYICVALEVLNLHTDSVTQASTHTQAHRLKKAEEKLFEGNHIEVWWPKDSRHYAANIIKITDVHIYLLYDDGTRKFYTREVLVPRIATAEVRDSQITGFVFMCMRSIALCSRIPRVKPSLSPCTCFVKISHSRALMHTFYSHQSHRKISACQDIFTFKR